MDTHSICYTYILTLTLKSSVFSRLDPVPNRPMTHPRMAVDHLAMHKPVPRGPPMYPSQQGEHFYPPEPRAPPSTMQYESTQYPPGKAEQTTLFPVISYVSQAYGCVC